MVGVVLRHRSPSLSRGLRWCAVGLERPEVPGPSAVIADGVESLGDWIEHDQELEVEPLLAEQGLDLVGHLVNPGVVSGFSVSRRWAGGGGLSGAGSHRSSLDPSGTNEGAPATAYFTFGG